MAEDVGEIENILIFMVIRSRKEMTEVMRKNFYGVYTGDFSDFLHFRPNITAVERVSFLRQEDRTSFYLFLLQVLRELLSELFHDEHLPGLPFAVYVRIALLNGFDRNIPELTDPDPGAGNRFHHERDLFLSLLKRGLNEPQVLLLFQFLSASDEHLLLALECTHAALLPAEVVKEHVECHQHTVHAAGLIALGQRVLILDYSLFRHLPIRAQPDAELPYVTEVLLDRCWAFLHFHKIKSILTDFLQVHKLSHPTILLL